MNKVLPLDFMNYELKYLIGEQRYEDVTSNIEFLIIEL
jgi:hypothetical protein